MQSALPLEALAGSSASRLQWDTGVMSSNSQASLNIHPSCLIPSWSAKLAPSSMSWRKFPQEHYFHILLPHSGCLCPSGIPSIPFPSRPLEYKSLSEFWGFIKQEPDEGLRQIYMLLHIAEMYIKCTEVWENTCLLSGVVMRNFPEQLVLQLRLWKTYRNIPGWLAEETDILKIRKMYLKLEEEEWVNYRNHRDVGKSLRYSWQGLVPMSHFRKKQPTKSRKAFALYPKNS